MYIKFTWSGSRKFYLASTIPKGLIPPSFSSFGSFAMWSRESIELVHDRLSLPDTCASSTDVYCRFCVGVRCRCNVEGSTPGRIRLACGYASIFSSRDGPAPLWHEQCLDCFRLWRLIFLRFFKPKCKQDPPRFQLVCIKFIHKRRKRGWPCLQGVSTSPKFGFLLLIYTMLSLALRLPPFSHRSERLDKTFDLWRTYDSGLDSAYLDVNFRWLQRFWFHSSLDLTYVCLWCNFAFGCCATTRWKDKICTLDSAFTVCKFRWIQLCWFRHSLDSTCGG